MWLHVCVVVKCAMLWKWSSPHYLCELVICISTRHWLWQVLCALRKNEYLRGCTISRDVSRAAMDTIFRGTYCALRWLLLSRVVSHAAMDNMERYVPHGSRTERQRVCIVRECMHHYTWHRIAHFIIDELEHVFCWSCDWLSAKFVIDKYWACYWGYIICWIVVVEGM